MKLETLGLTPEEAEETEEEEQLGFDDLTPEEEK